MNNKKINIDILKHLEDLTNEINKLTTPHAKNIFHRYPITFGLLILIGVITLNEGLKGILRDLNLLDINPWYLIIVGLAILTITGTIYRKLNK